MTRTRKYTFAMAEPQKKLNAEAVDFQAMHRNAADAVRLLKSIANESRLMVLCVLAEGEFSVGALNERIDLSQSALSQHLAILREQGLVKTRRESQTIYYSLADTAALSLINTLHDIYCVPARRS
jgi:DNA-binding transcriptional ArsR family regulator